jgi:hypothetical protein
VRQRSVSRRRMACASVVKARTGGCDVRVWRLSLRSPVTALRKFPTLRLRSLTIYKISASPRVPSQSRRRSSSHRRTA